MRIGIVKRELKPESEFWETGYWTIPKNSKVEILNEEKDEYLIEYLECGFYVDKKDIEA